MSILDKNWFLKNEWKAMVACGSGQRCSKRVLHKMEARPIDLGFRGPASVPDYQIRYKSRELGEAASRLAPAMDYLRPWMPTRRPKRKE